MKLKSFQKYIEKRLTSQEIAEIEQQAQLEKKVLESMQQDIAHAVDIYMKKNNIKFNDLVEQLDVSPTHIAKIKKGTANLTLASIANLLACIGQEPHSVFKKK